MIDSANTADQLRRRLKNEELEQYGEPFTPEFVYEVIRKLPRFASMRVRILLDAVSWATVYTTNSAATNRMLRSSSASCSSLWMTSAIW